MQKKNICSIYFHCRIDMQFFMGHYNKIFTPLSLQVVGIQKTLQKAQTKQHKLKTLGSAALPAANQCTWRSFWHLYSACYPNMGHMEVNWKVSQKLGIWRTGGYFYTNIHFSLNKSSEEWTILILVELLIYESRNLNPTNTCVHACLILSTSSRAKIRLLTHLEFRLQNVFVELGILAHCAF